MRHSSFSALALAVSVALTPTAGAQGSAATAPRFTRPVVPGARGANRLPVDLPLLVGASPIAMGASYTSSDQLSYGDARAGLGDLRLHQGPSGAEVPYLLVWPREEAPKWRGGRIIPVTPGRDSSGFELDLGQPTVVDAIDVGGLPEGTLKRVRLEGSGDRVRWTSLVALGTLGNVAASAGQPPMRQTMLTFGASSYRYLRLIGDDHAGARLPAYARARARLASATRQRVDSLRVPLTVARRPSARGTSRYHLTLPASALPVAALQLSVGGEQVLREFWVTRPHLEPGGVAPLLVQHGTLRRGSASDTSGDGLRIPIDGAPAAELDLVVRDGDNPPLDIRGVSALLQPLPSIYFVTSSTDSMWATYGTGRRTPVVAPRYDLEAIPDSVRRQPVPVASWGPPRAADSAAVAAEVPRALHAGAGSVIAPSSFRFTRALPEGEGLTAVRLDAAVLAHSHLDDVRILDAQGRQVPYLLESLEEPTEVQLPAPVPATPRADIDGREVPDAASRTWYRLQLPYAGLPDATLRLATTARVFQRDVAIVTRELPRDARVDELPPRTITAPWSHDDPDASAPALEVALGARLPSDSLFVLVNDGDNGKLPLASPTLLLHTYRLRFFREPGVALTLAYGRTDLGAPRYDLALLAPRLVDEAAPDVVPAPEGSAPAPTRGPQLIFWAVLGVAVLVLLVMVARLVRAPRREADAPLEEERAIT